MGKKLISLLLALSIVSVPVFGATDNELNFIMSYFIEDYTLVVDEESPASNVNFDTNTITVGRDTEGEEEIEFIVNYFDDRVENELPDDEVIFLLHEVGHVRTKDLWEDGDYLEYILFAMLDNSETQTDRFYAYRNLRIEKLADDWAIKVLEHNFRGGKFVVN